jgi:hypothetical protein
MEHFEQEYIGQFHDPLTLGVASWVIYHFMTEKRDRELPHRMVYGEALVHPDYRSVSIRYAKPLYQEAFYRCLDQMEDPIQARETAHKMLMQVGYGTPAGEHLLENARALWRKEVEQRHQEEVRTSPVHVACEEDDPDRPG